MNSPTRAVRLTLLLEADTVDDLAHELRHIAFEAQAGKLTTGASGGCCAGSVYELLIDPEQTHERYFEQVHAYLAERKAAAA